MTTTRKPAEIQSAAIYRVTDKATHEVFYLVKSDSDAGTWYELHFDHAAIRWQCSCPSTRPCKHEKAVAEILRIRRARTAEKLGGDMPAIVAVLQHEEDERARLFEARKQPPTPARSFEDWGSCDDATRRGFPGNQAPSAPAEQRQAHGRYHAGMFNQSGASCYVSDEEMAEIHARVAARRQSSDEQERRMAAPLNGNQGFSLLKR